MGSPAPAKSGGIKRAAGLVQIDSVVPPVAPVGSIVTVNFAKSPTPEEPFDDLVVYFDGTPGKVIGLSRQSLTVIVPEVSAHSPAITITGDLISATPWTSFRIGSPDDLTIAGLSIPRNVFISSVAAGIGMIAVLLVPLAFFWRKAALREADLKSKLDEVNYSFDRRTDTADDAGPTASAEGTATSA